jgi:hypothetical protein
MFAAERGAAATNGALNMGHASAGWLVTIFL